MAKDWKHISTAPHSSKPFLVCGGEIESELYAAEPLTSAAKVTQERIGKFDVVDTCGYAVWINNPEFWCDLPEPVQPAKPAQEFDL